MRHPISVLLALCFLYLLTFGGHLYSPDEEILFRTTEALATRASFAIEPLRGPYGDTFATRHPRAPRPDGLEYAQYGIGQPILAIPFYYLGKALRPLASDETWTRLQEKMLPYGPPLSPAETATRLGVSGFNIPITALSGMVLFLLARRLCGRPKFAWIAALAWGVGSLAWPYAKTFFTEPLAGLCLLLSLYFLARIFHPDFGTRPRSARLAFLAGAAAGFGCLVRVDWPIFLPTLALLAAWGDFSARQDSQTRVGLAFAAGRLTRHTFSRPVLGRLLFFLIPIVGAGAIRLLLNFLHFGGFFETGYADQPEGVRFTTPLLAGLYGFFLSVGKGMFFFSPALVLAFWGTRPMLRRRPAFGAAILLLFLSFLVVMSKWQNWAGGWCWGPRHIVQIHALLALPIAFWAAERWNSLRRVTITSLLIAGAAVQLYGCSQDFILFYRIYFQDPRPPVAAPLYTPGELETRVAIYPRDPRAGHAAIPLDPTGKPLFQPNPLTGRIEGELPARAIPAPINDSVYIAQNSQWPRYAEMWRMGTRDFFWLHLISD